MAAQVDLISFNGPTFKNWDNRVAALRLVQKNLCDAALFDPSGEHAGSSPLHTSCRLCMSATTRTSGKSAAALTLWKSGL